jgi:hypothetical protein
MKNFTPYLLPLAYYSSYINCLIKKSRNIARKTLVYLCLVIALFFSNAPDSLAGTLTERLQKFPAWENKQALSLDDRDLFYPDWMAGTWEVTSTLIDLVSPLAPEIVTPGFADNKRYLDRPIKFRVRFGENYGAKITKPKTIAVPVTIAVKLAVVADRAFNGLEIARTYLGDRVKSVKVAPDNPNRQVTVLEDNKQLISTITGRKSETPAPDTFVATEITQQVFQGKSQIYLNEVETTTAYQLIDSEKIEAEQVTAIYLSPQDPNYFKAANRPVALYRYRIELCSR